ncbi:MAG: 2-oxoisovalerate dehydrogenase E1 subunit beta [Cuspidothrix sp.]
MSENRIKEIIFLVEEDDEGSYIAKAVNQSIFTQADSLEELRELIKDAVHCHYPDEQNRSQLIRLHIVRDEVIASSNYPETYQGKNLLKL